MTLLPIEIKPTNKGTTRLATAGPLMSQFKIRKQYRNDPTWCNNWGPKYGALLLFFSALVLPQLRSISFYSVNMPGHGPKAC